MTTMLSRWLRHLTGPAGRRLLLAFAVSAAWLAWLVLPPRPLREWAATSLEPAEWFLTSDRTRLVCGNRWRRHVVTPGHTNIFHESGPVRLWDLATGRERLNVETDFGLSPQLPTGVAPDGSWLLTARRQDPKTVALQLWDTATGHERWSLPIRWSGNYVHRYAVSPDGRFIAYHPDEGFSQVLLTATGQVQFTFGQGWPLAFAPNGRTLAVVNYPSATVVVWGTASGQPGRQFTLKHGSPWAAALSPDGLWFAVGLWSQPEVVELWNLRTVELTAEFRLKPDPVTTTPVPPWRRRVKPLPTDRLILPDLDLLFFSPDGSLLIGPYLDKMWAWDVTQSPPRGIDIRGPVPRRSSFASMPTRRVVYPVFAPDGTRFVEPTPDDVTLDFRETSALDRAVVVGQDVEAIDRPDFAPDGRSLAVLHATEFLEPWQRAANWLGQKLSRPPAYAAVERIELVVFDPATGARRGSVPGFTDRTHLIGFGPDGRSVWTFIHTPDATGDGTLRVQEWAVPTGWPPWWLLAVTALGMLLAIADWRRERRRLTAPVVQGHNL